MFKYLTTKNIENYKYEISVLKNSKVSSNKDQKCISNAESAIHKGKYLTRIYIGIEIAFLFYGILRKKKSIKKEIALSFLRLNMAWVASNIFTNYYLENSDIRNIIAKHKINKDEFNFGKFIEHKM